VFDKAAFNDGYLTEEDGLYYKKYIVFEKGFIDPGNFYIAILFLISGVIRSRFKRRYLRRRWEKKKIALSPEEKKLLRLYVLDRMTQDWPIGAETEILESLLKKDILYKTMNAEKTRKVCLVQHWTWDFFHQNKHILKTE
jgi:hypothetical protein